MAIQCLNNSLLLQNSPSRFNHFLYFGLVLGSKTKWNFETPNFVVFWVLVGGLQTQHETPTRHETMYFSIHAMAENAAKLMVFCRFQTMNFNAPSITDVNTTWNNMAHNTQPALHPTWNHKPNAKLGSATSPDTKHTRHETISSFGGFSAATAVEIASQGCPCRVQQPGCFLWGLVSWGVCGPLILFDTCCLHWTNNFLNCLIL